MSLIHHNKISFLKEPSSSDHTPQSISHRFSPAKSSPFSNKSAFSFTGISNSRLFLSNPASPNGKTADTLQIINSISDVNDVGQVGKALGSVQSVKARIQLVDQIIQKRQEIKDAEDELKLERVTPTIQKLTMNFKKRIRKAKSNDGKLSFQKNLLSLINEEVSPLRPPGKEGSKELNSPKNSMNMLSKSDVPALTRKISLLCPPSKKAGVPSIKLDPSPSNMPSLLLDLGMKPSQSEGTVPEYQLLSPNKQNGTLAQILGPPITSKKTKNRVALLLRQTATSMTKSELPLISDEKKETAVDSKGNKLSSRTRKAITTSLKQAKQEIEKDLYHHLVNNNNQETDSVNILSFRSKKGSLGNIESRVKAKYESHINLKDGSTGNYFVPASFAHRKSSLGILSPPSLLDYEVPKHKALNSYRANATVRHINYDIFATPAPIGNSTNVTMSMKNNSKIMENSMNLKTIIPNDSFMSRLETQLEDVYNQQQNMKELDLKLGHSKSHSHAAKFQKNKVIRLRNNSNDITRISQKKALMT